MSATRTPVEIKICGLTDVAQALACVAAGATAIGLVFHPASPRCLTVEQARAIARALPAHVAAVAVWAEADVETILDAAAAAGLRTVQLHGRLPAPPQTLARLRLEGLHVIQALALSGAALLRAASELPADLGLLVECGHGALPGGNGAPWNWSEAAVLRHRRPFAIAGGLTPDNTAQALQASGATAVDVSSGVETTPGVKDLEKVRRLLAALRDVVSPLPGRVFRAETGES